jgi:hypothetical protein
MLANESKAATPLAQQCARKLPTVALQAVCLATQGPPADGRESCAESPLCLLAPGDAIGRTKTRSSNFHCPCHTYHGTDTKSICNTVCTLLGRHHHINEAYHYYSVNGEYSRQYVLTAKIAIVPIWVKENCTWKLHL